MSSTSSSVAPVIRWSDVPKGRLIIWLLVAGEVTIFGGGVMAYLLNRVRIEDWKIMAALTSTPIGAINTIVLLTSSFFVVKAHEAAAKRELGKVKMFLGLTILFGAIFLSLKIGLEWIPHIKEGVALGISDPGILAAFGPGVSFWSYYYFLTGMHAVHVILGMLAIFIVIINTRRGNNLHRIEMVGIYWHFVDLVWIFLFPLFYIAK